jgi:hypothetical protein
MATVAARPPPAGRRLRHFELLGEADHSGPAEVFLDGSYGRGPTGDEQGA